MNESKYVWIHYSNMTGTEDYSVTDWTAAKSEAADIIECAIGYCTDKNVVDQIKTHFASDDWMLGVDLFNAENAVGEYLALREGEKAW